MEFCVFKAAGKTDSAAYEGNVKLYCLESTAAFNECLGGTMTN